MEISGNVIIGIYGVTFTTIVTLFGIIFVSQNKKIQKIDEGKVDRGYCHKAQEVVGEKIEGSEKAIKAELNGVKTTLCAKIDGINGKE